METVCGGRATGLVLSDRGLFYAIRGFFHGDIVAGFSAASVEGDITDYALRLFGEAGCGSAQLAYMDQMHGGDVRQIVTAGKYVCDGLVTSSADVMLAVKSADCMPILVAAEDTTRVAAIHMGWRSAAAGILSDVGIDLSRAKVYAGVGLRRCCYEVGDDFMANASLGPFVENDHGRSRFDPIAYVRHIVCGAGLDPSAFVDSGICSRCSPLGFPSYRRTKAAARTFTFIGRRGAGGLKLL